MSEPEMDPHDPHALAARYFDGELDAEEEVLALDHLASCAACQAELGDLVGLEVALQRPSEAAEAGASGVARVTEGKAASAELLERPTSSPDVVPDAIPIDRARRRASRRWWLPVGGVAALAAAAAIVLSLRSVGPTGEEPPSLALAATRGAEARFTAEPFARHRPYEVARSGGSVEQLSLSALAEMEKRGDRSALAAAQALRGEAEQARLVLRAAPASPARDADLSAAELLAGDPEAALEAADRALQVAPALTVALWNRALALRELGLSLAAAAAFAEVAQRDEVGWSAEAAAKATALRAAMSERGPRAKAFTQAARAMVDHQGPPLTAADASSRPGLSRLYFLDALRAAETRAQAESLLPLAEALDRSAGNSLARAAVEAVARADFQLRAPLALAYRELISGRAPGTAPALLARVAKATTYVADLRLGAALSGRNLLPADELARLLEETRDPWFLLHLPRERANALLAAGAADRAETELRTALAGCDERLWAFRCARLAHDLMSLYLDRTRYVEAEEHARRASRSFAASGATELEDATLIALAELQRGRGRAVLADATFEEVIARLGPDDCRTTRYATNGRAIVSVYRRASLGALPLTAVDACGEPPSPVEVGALVDLARMSGRAEDRARAAAWIAAARGAGDADLARIAAAAEARLEIERDPQAAARLRALLPQLTGQDQPTVGFRAWVFQTLVDDAAARGAWADAVAIFAEELGTVVPARCALAVSLDDTRGTAVVIGGGGTLAGARSSVTAPPEWNGATLVPEALRQALAGCAKISVLARPPLHGRGDLLPPELPWVFLGERAVAPAASAVRRELFVGDALPPAALTLPALAPMPPHPPVAPEQGAVSELRGVAATPAAVLAALADATYAELHVHGQVDLGVADASFLALSPGADQRWALTAAEVRTAKLSAAPVIVLAACRAAAVAPFEHKRWSLPDAFLEAGARAVIAPTVEVPDSEAAAFFAELRGRLANGEDPAAALAALRSAYLARGAAWAGRVILFN